MGQTMHSRTRPIRPDTSGAATTGDILAGRRRRAGFSHEQIAAADGEWSAREVAEWEALPQLPASVVMRYLAALKRWGV